jgi:hypothetical protein
MSASRRMKAVRRKVKAYAVEEAKRPLPRAPWWRRVLARIGIKRPFGRWLVVELARREYAIRAAVKSTAHEAVKGA